MKLEILKNRNFTLLMLGKATSLLGSDMQQFALSLYVLSVTGSATIFASMLAISILPRLLFSPVAGVFGDWFDRKKSIVGLDLLNSLLIGAFAVYYMVHGSLSIPSIYVLVMLLETTEIFFGSAMAAVVPSMVPQEKLFDANALRSMLMSLCTIIAPLLAGVLYGNLGLLGVLLINAVSFFLSAVSEMFIVIPAYHKKPEKINLGNFRKDLLEGWKLVKSHAVVRNIIGLGMILNFCLGSLFSVGLLYIIRETLQGSDLQYGFFASALSFAMLIAPILLGGFARKVSLGKLMVYTFFGVSLIILLMAGIPAPGFRNAFATNEVPFLLLTFLSFLVGMGVTVVNIAIGTLFDTIVPKPLMGRTSSMMNLAVTVAMPLGQLLYGLALDHLSPSWPMIAVGVIMLAAVTYYRKIFLSEGMAEPEKAII